MTAANVLYSVILRHLGGTKGLAAKYVKARNALLEEVGVEKLPPCVRGRTKLRDCSNYFKKKATANKKRKDILKEEFAALRGARPKSSAPPPKPVVVPQVVPQADADRLAIFGYQLAGGKKTDEVLRKEVTEAHIFIALVTPQALCSQYVMFEMGARWGLDDGKRPLIPLVAQMKPEEVERPLGDLNLVNLSKRPQIYAMVKQLASTLGLEKRR